LASKMYMIDGLADECIRYVKDKTQADSVLHVLTACVTCGCELEEEIEKWLWCILLLNSETVLNSDSFIGAHYAIMSRLVKLDEFAACEETLWQRLVLWAEAVKDKQELLGSLNDALQEESLCKRAKVEGVNVSANTSAREVQILRCLAQHVRFPIMSKQFFCDNVMRFLPRDDSEAIMMFHLLGRAPVRYVSSPRSGLVPPEQVQIITVTAGHQSEEAQRLPQGDTTWQITTTNTAALSHLLHVESNVPLVPSKFVLTFGAERPVWPSIKVRRQGPSLLAWVDDEGTIKTNGRMKTFTVPAGRSFSSCRWQISFQSGATNLADASTYAALARIELYGKKELKGHAIDVVSRLCPDILVAPKVPERRAEEA